MLNRKNAKLRRALFTPLALVLAFVLAFGGLTSTIVMATDNTGGDTTTETPMENIDGGGSTTPGGETNAPPSTEPSGSTEPASSVEPSPSTESGEGAQGTNSDDTTIVLGNGTVLTKDANGGLTDPDGNPVMTDANGDPVLDEDGNPLPAMMPMMMNAPMNLLVDLTKDDFTYTVENDRITGVAYAGSVALTADPTWMQDENGGGTIAYTPADEEEKTLIISKEEEGEIVAAQNFVAGSISDFKLYFYEHKKTDSNEIPKELGKESGTDTHLVDSGEWFQMVAAFSLAPVGIYDNGKIHIKLPTDYIDLESVSVDGQIKGSSLNKDTGELTINLKDGLEGGGSLTQVAVTMMYKNGITPNGTERPFTAWMEAESKPETGSTQAKTVKADLLSGVVKAQAAEDWLVSKTVKSGYPKLDGDSFVVQYDIRVYSAREKDSDPNTLSGLTGRLFIKDFTLKDALSKTRNGVDHTAGANWTITKIDGNSVNIPANSTDQFTIATETDAMLSTSKTYTVEVKFPASAYTTKYENRDKENKESEITNTAYLAYTRYGDTTDTHEKGVPVEIGTEGKAPLAKLKVTKKISVNGGTEQTLTDALAGTYGKVKFTIEKGDIVDGSWVKDTSFTEQTKSIVKGVATFIDLPDGKYKITETADGWFSSKFTTKSYEGATDDGIVEISRATAEAGDAASVTVINKSEAGSFADLKIIKKSTEGDTTFLRGAEFKLYKEDKATLIGTQTTGNEGVVTFKNLEVGTEYWLVESKLPVDYKSATPDYTAGALVTIQTTGTTMELTIQNAPANVKVHFYKMFYGPDGNVMSLGQSPDASTLPSFEIRKKGETVGLPISPRILYEESGTQYYVQKDGNDEVTLAPGEYELWETKLNGLKWFSLPKEALATFTITQDQQDEFTILNKTPFLVTGDVKTAPFINSSDHGAITIKKFLTKDAGETKDPDGSGTAKFSYTSNDGKTTGTFEVEIKNGYGEYQLNLPAGTYTIKEIKGVDGYQMDSSEKSVTIVVLKPNETQSFYNPKLGSIEVSKTDIKTSSLITDKAAKFQLFKLDDKSSYVAYQREKKNYIVSTTDGKAIFDALEPGTYRVQEIEAPDGYQLSGKYAVAVNSQTSEEDISVNLYIPSSVEAPNASEAALCLIKVDQDGNTVSGAKFGLYDSDDKLLQEDTTSESNKGILTFSDLKDGVYTLKEIETPDGYFDNNLSVKITIANGTVTYSVPSNGALVILPTDGAYYGAATTDAQSVKFINKTKATLTIKKVGDSIVTPGLYNVPLAGATFNLYEKGKDSALTFTGSDGEYMLSTDEAAKTALTTHGDMGQLVIKGLDPEKEYELKETAAPEGYTVNDTRIPVKFTTYELEKTIQNDISRVKVRVTKYAFEDENKNGKYDTDKGSKDKLLKNDDLFNAQFGLFANKNVADAVAKIAADLYEKGESRSAIEKAVLEYLNTDETGEDGLTAAEKKAAWIGQRFLYTGTEETTKRNTALSDWFAWQENVYLVEILPPTDGGYSLPTPNSWTVSLSGMTNGQVKNHDVYDPYDAENGGGKVLHGQVQVEKLGRIDDKDNTKPLNNVVFKLYANDAKGFGTENWVEIDTIVTGSDGAGLETDPRPGFAMSRVFDFGEALYTSKAGEGKATQYTLQIKVLEYAVPAGYMIPKESPWIITLTGQAGKLIFNQELTAKGSGAIVNPKSTDGYFHIEKKYSDNTSGEVEFYVYADEDKTPINFFLPESEERDGKTIIRSGKTYGPIAQYTNVLYLEEVPSSVKTGYNSLKGLIKVEIDSKYTFAKPNVVPATNYPYLQLSIGKSDTEGNVIPFAANQSAKFSLRNENNKSYGSVTLDKDNQTGKFSEPLEDGIYFIEETDFAGFLTHYRVTGDDKKTVARIVVENGKIKEAKYSWAGGAENTFTATGKTGSNGTLIYFPNPKKGSIEVTKYLQEINTNGTDSSKKIAGDSIEFTLYAQESGGTPVEKPGTQEDYVIKTVGGKATFENLDANTYWIEETKGPADYQPYAGRKQVTLTAGDDHKISEGTVEFLNTTNKGKLQIIKQSTGGEEIKNEAVFQIYKTDGTTKGDAVGDPLKTTNASNKTPVVLLPAGKYWVEEITPPKGYGLAQNAKGFGYFIVDVEPMQTIGTEGKATTISEPKEVTFKNPPLPTFSVKKVDSEDTSKIIIPMARFTIYSVAEDGKETLLKILQTKSGVATFTAGDIPLTVGTNYLIRETLQPQGYELTDGAEPWSATFSVKTGGEGAKFAYYLDFGSNAAWDEEKLTITVPNKQTGAVIRVDKIGTDSDNDKLGGAEYVVQGKNADGSWASYGEKTTQQGAALEWLVPLHETYRVLEIEAPTGYSGALEETWVRIDTVTDSSIREYAQASAYEHNGKNYPGIEMHSGEVTRSGGVDIKVRFKNQVFDDPTPKIALTKRFADNTNINLYSQGASDRTATFYIENIYDGSNDQPLKNFTLIDENIEFFDVDDDAATPAPGYTITNVEMVGNGKDYATNDKSEWINAQGTGIKILYGDVVGEGENSYRRVEKGFTPKDLKVTVVFDERAAGDTIDEVRKIINTAQTEFYYRNNSGAEMKKAAAAAATHVLPSVNGDVPPMSITKTIEGGNDKLAPQGTDLEYQLVIKNHSDKAIPMVDPLVVDVLDEHLSFYGSESWAAPIINGNSQLTFVSAKPEEINKKAAMVWRFSGTLDAGDTITIKYRVLINPDAPAKKTLNNIAFLTSGQNGKATAQFPGGALFSGYNGSGYTHQLQYAQEGYKDLNGVVTYDNNPMFISSTAKVTTTNVNGYTISKMQKKEADSQYTTSVLTIEPGEKVNYQLILRTSTALEKLSVVDILPYENDYFILSKNLPRGTEWVDGYLQVLGGTVSVTKMNKDDTVDESFTDAAYKVYYLHEDNVVGWSGFTGDWSMTSGNRNYGVGIQLDDDYTLEPGEWLKINFTVQADDTIEAADYDKTHIGYNSIASFVDGSTGNVDSRKVGVRFEPKTVKIGDRIWLDEKLDGLQNEGEADLIGATAYLLKKTEKGFESAFDENGKDRMEITQEAPKYFFDVRPTIKGVEENEYMIRFELPEGYAFTSAYAGDAQYQLDSDAILEDKVSKPYATEAHSASFTVAVDGTLTYTSGDYVGKSVEKTGLLENMTIDAGAYKMIAMIGDYVWHDVNYDGKQNMDVDENGNLIEPPIGGVAVSLWTKNGEGKYEEYLDATGNPMKTTTDKDGYYQFLDLPFGAYYVHFDLESVKNKEYRFTIFSEGTRQNGADTSFVDPKNGDNTETQGYSHSVVLHENLATKDIEHGDGTKTTYFAALYADAGAYLLASLGDYVWHDVDRDGEQDANEVGINGAMVTLYKREGNDLVKQGDSKPTVTGSDGKAGYYLFDKLVPGDYVVRFDMPTGYNTRSPYRANGVGDDKNSDAQTSGNLVGYSDVVTLISEQHDPTIDAGFYYVESPPPGGTPTPTTPIPSDPTPVPTPSTTPGLFIPFLEEDPPEAPPEVQTVQLLELPEDEIPYGAIKPPANRSVDLTEDETPYGIVKTGEMAADMIAYLAIGLVIAGAGVGLMMLDRRRKAAATK